MKHEFLFYSGLPRAGGTMLASLMNQHPDMYCSPLSPTVEFLYYTEQYFLEGSEAYKSFPEPHAMKNVLDNMTENYYSHVKKKYVIDNNRAWPNNIDRIKAHITPNPKIVCIVRDVVEVLASFIDLMNKPTQRGPNFIDVTLINAGEEMNTENRCSVLMHPVGIVNQSLWAFLQGYEKHPECLHIVEYKDLIYKPEETMAGIVDFYGVPKFNFDYSNIVNVTPVDDSTYNLNGMHDVRPTLKDRMLDPYEILGRKIVEKYSGLEFWRKKNNKYKVFSI